MSREALDSILIWRGVKKKPELGSENMLGQNLLAESSKMESGHALYQVAKFVISHTGSVVSQCVIVCQLDHCAFEPTVLFFFF